MTRTELFLLSIFSLLMTCSQATYAADDTVFRGREAEILRSRAENIAAYAELVQAQSEYVRMIGEARLAWARANLTQAQAYQQWERARALRLMVKRLWLELKRLRQKESKLEIDAERIKKCARRVGQLAGGRTSIPIFQAIRVLLGQYIPSAVVVEAMTMDVPPLPGEHFIPWNKQADPIAFPGGNVGKLIHFLEKNRFSLEPWEEGHILILTAFEKMGDIAEKKIAEIRQYQDAIRKGVFDIWKAPDTASEEPPVTE